MPRPPIRTSVLSGLVAAALATTTILAVPDAPAAGEEDAGTLSPVSVLAPDPSLDPRIVALELRGSTWTWAVGRLDDALFAQNEARRARTRTVDLLVRLDSDRLAVERALTLATTERDDLEARLADVEEVLRAQAVDLFVNHGTGDLTAVESPVADTDTRRGRELRREATEVTLAEHAELESLLAELAGRAAMLTARSRELALEVAAATTALGELDDTLAEFDAEVSTATAAVVRARRSASIAGLDISVVALDAYLNAEDLLAARSPGCQVRWWMIAGVARVESRHGSFGSRTLRADGRPDRPIYGIPLDGRPGVREILDTDGGKLDGDTVHDRAVGPMQFIPETWSRRGGDGDGDGRADPQNIYDAAYSTGRYLCALGGDLVSTPSLRRAFFGYNTSTEYVDAVHGHALRYAGFGLPTVENSVENGTGTGD